MVTPEETARSKQAFLAAFRKTGNITRAAKAAKVARSQHYVWIEQDEQYAADLKDAQEEATDLLEDEARRRAELGTLEPVYYLGKKVGTVRRYSDTLLIFLLKGLRPEKYKDRTAIEHKGGITVHQKRDLSRLDEDELKTLERLVGKSADAGGDTAGESP